MEIAGRIAVVTGGASGIGRALCERLAAEGAAGVAVADVDRDGAEAVAADVRSGRTRALALSCDVSVESDVARLVARVESELGPVDLYCSNAGIALAGGVDVPDAEWDRIWRVNVLSHVYAARAVLPGMRARGGGCFLVTASAAGLLTSLGSAPYAVTKHAAVALAEWLAITYGADATGGDGTGGAATGCGGGERVLVSCLCPQGVRTPMLERGLEAGEPSATSVLASGAMIEPAAVADAVVEGLRAGRFLILPHREVAYYTRYRAEDPDRWLAGMRRLWARYD